MTGITIFSASMTTTTMMPIGARGGGCGLL